MMNITVIDANPVNAVMAHAQNTTTLTWHCSKEEGLSRAKSIPYYADLSDEDALECFAQDYGYTIKEDGLYSTVNPRGRFKTCKPDMTTPKAMTKADYMAEWEMIMKGEVRKTMNRLFYQNNFKDAEDYADTMLAKGGVTYAVVRDGQWYSLEDFDYDFKAWADAFTTLTSNIEDGELVSHFTATEI